MATASPDILIERSPDEVWALVGNFGNLDHMPGVDSCTVDGDDRLVETMGMSITERLVSRSDDDRTLVYSIVDGPVPVEHHEATVSVTPEGDASRVTWAVTVLPDDGIELFAPIYQGSLQALKEHLETPPG